MDTLQAGTVGACFLAAAALGGQAWWMTRKTVTMRATWRSATATVVRSEAVAFGDDPDQFFMTAQVQCAGEERKFVPEGSWRRAELAEGEARFAVGTTHQVLVDPKSGWVYEKLPIEADNPFFPALFAIGFGLAGAAAALGIWRPGG
jgi:hypothetical protein